MFKIWIHTLSAGGWWVDDEYRLTMDESRAGAWKTLAEVRSAFDKAIAFVLDHVDYHSWIRTW